MTGKDTILELQGISKHYGDTIALDGIDLEIERGEFLTLLGPSGSGKTTTLNLIAGFDQPTSGSMRLNGEPLDRLPPEKRGFGVVFQQYALFPHMTVAQNVEYPLKHRKIPAAERRSMVAEALEMVQLAGFENRRPRELSGGQQQRVAVARALVYRPPILLMDEPLGALDKNLREWLQTELRRIHREVGSTFVYVTHDQEEALGLSDRIAVFNEGRIEQVGTPHELYARPESLFVGRFIGESSVFRGSRWGDAAVLVRPENLDIRAGSAGSGSGLAATITDTVFLGSVVRVAAATELGEALAQVPESHAAELRVGDRVTVAWADEDAIVFSD